MGRDGRIQILSITGPDGAPLTLADLPAPNTRRWVSSRKAKIVAAVEGGLISFAEASRRYNLTLEEFSLWEDALHRRGPAGLKAHTAQQLRNDRVLEHPAPQSPAYAARASVIRLHPVALAR
jgi:hypothetical protein